MPRCVIPFIIVERVGKVTYRLELLANLEMHLVFHVSLLKTFSSIARHLRHLITTSWTVKCTMTLSVCLIVTGCFERECHET